MRTLAFKAIAFTALLALSAVVPASANAQTVLASAVTKKTNGTLLAQATDKQDGSETKAEEAKPAEPAKPAEVKVTVAEGDSLSSIATTHETTWVRLYNANESIANPNVINPGQELRVPRADEQLADRPLPVEQPVVASAPVATNSSYTARSYTRAPATSYALSGNAAKDFIYSRESGNNPNATNPSGCYGIGQDCNGVLRAQCGADYACQDAYFTGYAERRYGGWDGAYSFWQANGWW